MDSEGESWRYPEEGRLVTYGEGGCDECYEPYIASSVKEKFVSFDETRPVRVLQNGSRMMFTFKDDALSSSTKLTDLQGKTIATFRHDSGNSQNLVLDLSGIKPGVYYALHHFGRGVNGRVIRSRIVLHR